MLKFPRVHSLHVIICIHGASFRKECLYIRYFTLMLRNCPLRGSPRPAPPTPLALSSVRMTKLIARNLGLQILNQKAVFPRLSKACVIQSIIKTTHIYLKHSPLLFRTTLIVTLLIQDIFELNVPLKIKERWNSKFMNSRKKRSPSQR